MAAATFTIPEAAFVTGLSVRSVNHEIDRRVIDAAGDPVRRRLSRADLLYLGAVRNLRAELGTGLRRRLRDAIGAASDGARPAAQVDHLTVSLDAVEGDLDANLRALQRLRGGEVECRPDVLAGEPVLAGTRIPARHVADMVRRGASPGAVADELDLTAEQVAAAVLFDRVSPRQGRPPRNRRAARVPPPR